MNYKKIEKFVTGFAETAQYKSSTIRKQSFVYLKINNNNNDNDNDNDGINDHKSNINGNYNKGNMTITTNSNNNNNNNNTSQSEAMLEDKKSDKNIKSMHNDAEDGEEEKSNLNFANGTNKEMLDLMIDTIKSGLKDNEKM
ncbi:hypothetical protein RFI_24035, partial [Reticulomyxa filosa]